MFIKQCGQISEQVPNNVSFKGKHFVNKYLKFYLYLICYCPIPLLFFEKLLEMNTNSDFRFG